MYFLNSQYPSLSLLQNKEESPVTSPEIEYPGLSLQFEDLSVLEKGMSFSSVSPAVTPSTNSDVAASSIQDTDTDSVNSSKKKKKTTRKEKEGVGLRAQTILLNTNFLKKYFVGWKTFEEKFTQLLSDKFKSLTILFFPIQTEEKSTKKKKKKKDRTEENGADRKKSKNRDRDQGDVDASDKKKKKKKKKEDGPPKSGRPELDALEAFLGPDTGKSGGAGYESL